MSLARGVISQVFASTLNLQSTVDETSEKVKSMGAVHGLAGFIGSGSWILLIIIGISMVNRSVAGYIAIGIGKSILVLPLRSPELISIDRCRICINRLWPAHHHAYSYAHFLLYWHMAILQLG